MHYYQFNIGNYRRDTQHLTPLEHGIYRLLLDQYYLTEKPINANALRLLCIRSADEMRIAENILKEFFVDLGQGEFIHKGCDKVIEKFHGKSEKASKSAKLRWDANAMRTQCDGNANQEPITNNHKPITNNQEKALVPSDAGNAYCPHEKIINLYHQHLPTLPSVRVWTEARKKKLASRWKEDVDRMNLDYWENLFKYVAKSDFLCGRTTKPFTCDLEWIVTSSNFVKIIEGKYQNA